MKSLEVIRGEWAGCEKCDLHKDRGKGSVIIGEGNPNAIFLVVTEGITLNAAKTGRPLSLEHRGILRALLEEAGIDPATIYTTALTGCCSFAIIPATEETQEEIKDRVPSREEIAECLPRLRDLIYTIDPAIILTFGEAPWKALINPKDRGKHNKLTDAQGSFYDTWLQGIHTQVRYPVLVLPSISMFVTNPSTAPHGPIALTLNYLRQAAEYVAWLHEQEGTYAERIDPPQGTERSR